MNYFLENEKRFRAFFLLHSIDSVTVTFDGSGDSGQIDGVYLRKGGEYVDLNAPIMVWHHGGSQFDPKIGKWVKGDWSEQTKDIQEALRDHVYEALEDCDVDWYNNDGGHGEWNWNAQTGLHFEVNQRHVTSSTEHSEFRELGQEEDEEDAE